MEKLGIEPSLLLAQIVNFAIIVVVLTKLLYKPVLGMLEKRKKEIEEGLAITERMRAEAEKLGGRREKLIAEARSEARVILEDAKKQGHDAEREIVANAQKEAAEIIEKAKREAAATHEALSGDIRAEAINLAATMAKRLVAGILSPADQHKLIAKHLVDLGKAKGV
ncbi:F0F1 ATP synthase subunit B [Candidatus Gottesmanbacteria bacterium]|nr:F0F1 ATP synthase subunit B [Candidatus Gottesmanbacteria bacterium]